MANSYVMFSVQVSDITEAEREWIEKNEMGFYDQFDVYPDEWTDDVDVAADDFCQRWELDDSEDWPGFTCEFSRERIAVLYSEDSGNVENVAKFLQAFLRKFRPDQAISLEAAYTCSKMRPGEFGGCAAFITADGIEWNSTMHWLEEKRAEFKKEKESGNDAGSTRRGQLGQ